MRKEVFIYDWAIYPQPNYSKRGPSISDEDDLVIRAYGIDKEQNTTCLHIRNFEPYIYIALTPSFHWKKENASLVVSYMRKHVFPPTFTRYKFCHRRMLYHANMDEEGNFRKFPFIKCYFKNHIHFRMIYSRLMNPIFIKSLGMKLQFRVHEHNIPVLNQFICAKDIQTTGWLSFKGKPVDDANTSCKEEYNVSYTSVKQVDDPTPVMPNILSFDIETYSSNPNVMPNPTKNSDCIYQISCIFSKNGRERHLLTLGNPDPKTVGENVVLHCYKNEIKLIYGFIQLVEQYNPHVITGYNIMGFDIQYLIKRAELFHMKPSLLKLGMFQGQSGREVQSRLKNGQEIHYFDMEGRIWIDLLPFVRETYSLANYKLDTVAHHFLQANKDPITHHDIFDAYKYGVANPSEEGIDLLGRVGHYCIVDAELVMDLFEHLDRWNGLVEMASVCNIPPALVFRGQQIKVFAQIYRFCMNNRIVVQDAKSLSIKEVPFQGAMVIDPVPGIYENIVPMDFKSLYPTVIIAYNIDYSTLVDDDDNVPDEKCHVIEWEEHINCEHSEKKSGSGAILCNSYRFRFLKEPKGVIPTIIKDLLHLRAKTRQEMKVLGKRLKEEPDMDETEREHIQSLISVLDKRQWSYKISCNSMYGFFGVSPSKAYLPFVEGAMCTTAMGRHHLQRAVRVLTHDYKARLIYGDTDSNYIQFPNITDPVEIWKHAYHVEKDIDEKKYFPEPMKLEFEEKVFKKFFILTKKRYMWIEANPDGTIDEKIKSKGVLITRRDNSDFVRDLYEETTKLLLHNEPKQSVLNFISDRFQQALTLTIPLEKYVITKSVKDREDYARFKLLFQKLLEHELLPQGTTYQTFQEQLELYINSLNPAQFEYFQEQAKKLLKLKRLPTLSEQGLREYYKEQVKEYLYSSVPAHVQLASRMMNRGIRVDVGQRVEFVITKMGGKKAPLFKRIEEREYQQKFAAYIPIDHLYYLEAAAKPLDQLLEIVFEEKKLCHRLLEICQTHENTVKQINSLTAPTIKYI